VFPQSVPTSPARASSIVVVAMVVS
jgi:hypothetical protein